VLAETDEDEAPILASPTFITVEAMIRGERRGLTAADG
jgi:hypothetical protein